MGLVMTLALSSWPKQGAWKGAIKSVTLELHCYNPNIGIVTKCEVPGPMRARVCLGVKHTLTNGGKMQGMKSNDSQVHSHFGSCIYAGVANV
jgi:hypothetical protein